MQYLYDPDAKTPQLQIEGENFKYLSKVRHVKPGEKIALRNLEDGVLYTYEVAKIEKRRLHLQLLGSEKSEQSRPRLHLGWCVVDAKSVEKSLPFLNELGVAKITFIYCDKSQRNFKLNFDRLKRINIGSSQQCGRDGLIELDSCESIEAFIKTYPHSYLCDFCDTPLEKSLGIETLIIGPEGGLSRCERDLKLPRAGFATPSILRSETAAVAAAAKLLS